MRVLNAISEAVKSKRIWAWELGSFVLHVAPALVRFATKNPVIPILNEPGYSIAGSPPNLVEHLITNPFFPGGAGAVVGETLVSNYTGRKLAGKSKYLARLGGALLQYGVWTGIQYLGYLQDKIGPHGENIFDPPEKIPYTLGLTVLSVFTPDVVDYANKGIQSLYRRVRAKNFKI
ncbi:MAG: hypothetical protein HY361_04685 [Candidatus Aenigmarchaeota archaeon]|nr:hypothetical protein [Candidatus Aenigmarchaeota archaeon]